MTTTTTTELDLAAYLARIGEPGLDTPDLPTLRRIVAAHTRSITFENLDAFTGHEPRLDAEGLEAKLVRGGRGGWCFEQNGLLRLALDALGYRTTGLAARVLWGRPPDAPPSALSHMLLLVDLPEGPHLVDVGFGGGTPTGVLALEPEVEQPTPHEPFRLSTGADGAFPPSPTREPAYVMQVLIGSEWRALYRFDLTAHLPVDYTVSNFYLARHPQSQFVTGLMVARPDHGCRYALNSTTFSVHHLGGPSKKRTLESPSAVRAVLEEHFLLDLSALPDLDSALARLF